MKPEKFFYTEDQKQRLLAVAHLPRNAEDKKKVIEEIARERGKSESSVRCFLSHAKSAGTKRKYTKKAKVDKAKVDKNPAKKVKSSEFFDYTAKIASIDVDMKKMQFVFRLQMDSVI